MKITKAALISLITDALDAEDPITGESSMDSIPEWDSLGHLSVLTSLDQATDGKASAISELGESSSVDMIFNILKNENLVDES
jgi:hypothetical protein